MAHNTSNQYGQHDTYTGQYGYDGYAQQAASQPQPYHQPTYGQGYTTQQQAYPQDGYSSYDPYGAPQQHPPPTMEYQDPYVAGQPPPSQQQQHGYYNNNPGGFVQDPMAASYPSYPPPQPAYDASGYNDQSYYAAAGRLGLADGNGSSYRDDKTMYNTSNDQVVPSTTAAALVAGGGGVAAYEMASHRQGDAAPPAPAPEQELRDGTLAGEYAAAQRGGLDPSQQTRGSVAAQMAAEGTIPEKAGLKMWRADEHAGEFTRGGKKRCCGRCCCCTIILVLLLIVGIVAAFLLWVRPPNINFNGVEPPSAGTNQVALVTQGFQLNFKLDIDVTNPNFFGASFTKIDAQAFYPNHTDIALGGGEISNVNIKSHSNTTIHFPFQVNYTTQLDPDRSILTDLASRCGFLGSNASKIVVDYKLVLHTKVAFFTISPTFRSSTSFDCPLQESDIASVLGSSNGNIAGLLGALSSSSGSSSGGGSSVGSGTKRSIELESRDLDRAWRLVKTNPIRRSPLDATDTDTDADVHGLGDDVITTRRALLSLPFRQGLALSSLRDDSVIRQRPRPRRQRRRSSGSLRLVSRSVGRRRRDQVQSSSSSSSSSYLDMVKRLYKLVLKS